MFHTKFDQYFSDFKENAEKVKMLTDDTNNDESE